MWLNSSYSGPNGGKSRCDFTKFCHKCSKSYYTNKTTGKHECGESYCHRCQEKKQAGHTCTMMPSIKNEKKLTRKRGFFDVEVLFFNNNLKIIVVFLDPCLWDHKKADSNSLHLCQMLSEMFEWHPEDYRGGWKLKMLELFSRRASEGHRWD